MGCALYVGPNHLFKRNELDILAGWLPLSPFNFNKQVLPWWSFYFTPYYQTLLGLAGWTGRTGNRTCDRSEHLIKPFTHSPRYGPVRLGQFMREPVPHIKETKEGCYCSRQNRHTQRRNRRTQTCDRRDEMQQERKCDRRQREEMRKGRNFDGK